MLVAGDVFGFNNVWKIKTFSIVSPITLMQIILFVVVINRHIQIVRDVVDI